MSEVFRFFVWAFLLVVMMMTDHFRVIMPSALIFVLFYFRSVYHALFCV